MVLAWFSIPQSTPKAKGEGSAYGGTENVGHGEGFHLGPFIAQYTGTKDEDVPSGPALAAGLLCDFMLVAKPFCVALIFISQTEKRRC